MYWTGLLISAGKQHCINGDSLISRPIYSSYGQQQRQLQQQQQRAVFAEKPDPAGVFHLTVTIKYFWLNSEVDADHHSPPTRKSLIQLLTQYALNVICQCRTLVTGIYSQQRLTSLGSTDHPIDTLIQCNSIQ